QFKVVELHHTVVFVANGGSGTMASDVATKGQHYTLPACGFTAPLGKVFDHWVVDYTGIEEDPIKQPCDYFTAPYIWNESDVQTITVTAYWRDALILLNDDSAQPEGNKNANIIAANNGMTDLTVQLQGRTLYKDGKWNTLCLPFSMTAEQIAASPLADCTLNELDITGIYDTDKQTGYEKSTGTLSLYFKPATSIEAGKPYLIKWESGDDIVNPVFNGVTISSTASPVAFNGGQFIGTYSAVNLTSMDKSNIWFVGAENTLYNPDESSTSLKSLRAYFQLTEPASGVKSINMNFGEDATGIKRTEDTEKTEATEGVIYNLQGQRLNGVQKGINIVNGKKVLIK
ncbi:MAG: hypothetical protein IJ557_07520, partial [Bacteroidaceae bacterium]|nr:hypothetical protein [Bacteroidaceae bacterium]